MDSSRPFWFSFFSISHTSRASFSSKVFAENDDQHRNNAEIFHAEKNRIGYLAAFSNRNGEKKKITTF
jgi:hypothetical protein